MSMIYIYLVLIVILSAFFSGSEIAYLSVDRLRIELDRDKGGVRGYVLSMLYNHPDRFISTMLVGNNIVLVVYGLLMSRLLNPLLSFFIAYDWLLLIVNTLLSTFLIVVFGEYLPKASFRRNPNETIDRFLYPLVFFYVLLYPLSLFCTAISRLFILIVVPKGKNKPTTRRLTTIDLNHYLTENNGENVDGGHELDTEVKIIRKAIDFSNVQARDCMIPRNEIVACDHDTDIEDLKQLFIQSGLTKIVVYKENIDNVVGYIHSSEMFKGEDWQERLKSAVFVPDSLFGYKLMEFLMQQKKSIAIVIDELGGTAGLVTLEDLVEEIFGDIQDEHDTNSIIAKKQDENTYILSGRLEIDDANERLSLNLPESDDYLTIAGLILSAYPHIPNPGEVVVIDRFSFRILRSSESKIELVKLTITNS